MRRTSLPPLLAADGSKRLAPTSVFLAVRFGTALARSPDDLGVINYESLFAFLFIYSAL